MLTRDFVLGIGTTLLLLAIGEALALLASYRENKQLKIDKIAKDAHETVEKMSDDELRSKLNDELK